MKPYIIILFSILSIACTSQEKVVNTNKTIEVAQVDIETQIGEYVTSVYEDSKANLWFGTMQKGIAKYDGNVLIYFTTKDGLPSNRALGIIEDANGIYWLTTGAGISKYDGKNFTNISVKEDLINNSISTIFIDSKGIFWLGTWGGVYKFDGKEFQDFPLPNPKVETPINEDTKNWITVIKEDSEGNIWIGRDNYGAYKFDGKSFTHFLKKDGLHSNNVTQIEFDVNGNVWFGTRVAEKDNPDPNKRFGKGGVNMMTKDTVVTFPEIAAFNNNDVYEIYKDSAGNIWISTIKEGVFKYDGKTFENYDVPISIMGMFDDQKGNLWLAGAGGLYKINQKGEVINVTINGPWK